MAAAGGLIRLPKRVPLAIALELAMTGDPIDADARAAARAREPGRARRRGARQRARARRPDREQLPDRGAAVAPAGAGGGRARRGRRLAAHERARDRGLLERRRDRGRHRLRREAPARLEEHSSRPETGTFDRGGADCGSECSYNRTPMERWRVEDLAGRAEVSVDTIRFYQKRRLLAPPAPRGPRRLVRARAPRAAAPDPRAAGATASRSR